MKSLLINESINWVKEWLPLIAIEKFPLVIIIIVICIQAGKIILKKMDCNNNLRMKQMEYAYLEGMKKNSSQEKSKNKKNQAISNVREAHI